MPSLSEGVAIAAGAATLNPLVRAAALAAQKLLQDPLGKLFASEYRITGVASPKIDSVSRTLRQTGEEPMTTRVAVVQMVSGHVVADNLEH